MTNSGKANFNNPWGSMGAHAAVPALIDPKILNLPSFTPSQNLLRTFTEAFDLVSPSVTARFTRSIAPMLHAIDFQKMIGISPIKGAIDSMMGNAIKSSGFDSLIEGMLPISQHIATLNLPAQLQISDAISQVFSSTVKIDFGAAAAMARYGRLAESSHEFAAAAASMRESLAEIQGVPVVVEKLTASAFRRMRGSTISWAQLEWGAFMVVSMLIMTITLYGAQSAEVHALFSLTGYNNLAGALSGGYVAKKGVRKLAIKKGDPRRR